MLTSAGAATPEIGWTFDDFDKIAADATKDGKYGFAMGMGGYQWMSMPIAYSATQPASEDGSLHIDEKAFVDAATFFSSTSPWRPPPTQAGVRTSTRAATRRWPSTAPGTR